MNSTADVLTPVLLAFVLLLLGIIGYFVRDYMNRVDKRLDNIDSAVKDNSRHIESLAGGSYWPLVGRVSHVEDYLAATNDDFFPVRMSIGESAFKEEDVERRPARWRRRQKSDEQ